MTGELLTNCASVISEPLSALFTKSLNEGFVPTLLKRAAVVPIYKGGDRSLPSNYIPVSLTPILMKVMQGPHSFSLFKLKTFLKTFLQRLQTYF